MNFIEFIGFVITMVAFFLLMIKQARDARRRKAHPEEIEDQEQDPSVQALLKTLNIQVGPIKPVFEESEQVPLEEEPEEAVVHKEVLPPPPPEPVKAQKTKIASPYAHLFTHEKAYGIQKQAEIIRKDLLKTLTLKEAIILREILGPCKADPYVYQRTLFRD